MSKDIKDYLHLYLGCRCKYKHQEKKGLINIHEGVGMWRLVTIHYLENSVTLEAKGCMVVAPMNEVKPILRPLSDMTDWDWVKLSPIIPSEKTIENSEPEALMPATAEAVLYLLKEGFDLFNLIGEGLAIDKTKQPA